MWRGRCGWRGRKRQTYSCIWKVEGMGEGEPRLFTSPLRMSDGWYRGGCKKLNFAGDVSQRSLAGASPPQHPPPLLPSILLLLSYFTSTSLLLSFFFPYSPHPFPPHQALGRTIHNRYAVQMTFSYSLRQKTNGSLYGKQP